MSAIAVQHKAWLERQYNNREWVLTAWLRPDLSRIENATFRPAAAAGGPP